jgi:predicted ATPase
VGSHPFLPFPPRRVVVTGGPGAGKTAVLELARRNLCEHVEVLPESARIIFGGGFPRLGEDAARRAAQRAIWHVQDELETLSMAREDKTMFLCDRGTLDGLAYWPGTWDEFFDELETTHDAELARYSLVLHLRTPGTHNGYHQDKLRTESAREANLIDARLLEVWAKHPHRHVIEATEDFLAKARRALDVLRDHLPDDCRNERTRPVGT